MCPPTGVGQLRALARHLLERLEPVVVRNRAPQPAEHAGRHRDDIHVFVVTEGVARLASLQQQRDEVTRLGEQSDHTAAVPVRRARASFRTSLWGLGDLDHHPRAVGCGGRRREGSAATRNEGRPDGDAPSALQLAEQPGKVGEPGASLVTPPCAGRLDQTRRYVEVGHPYNVPLRRRACQRARRLLAGRELFAPVSKGLDCGL